jgi:hypothetical protein
MNRLVSTARLMCVGIVTCLTAAHVIAANGMMASALPPAAAAKTNAAPVAKEVPVTSWVVDTAAGVAKLGAKGAGKQQKAAGDLITVFRPLPGCRLYDSRTGNPSALGTLGGTWFPASALRTLNAGGQCGIPTGNVAGLSLAINVFNWSNPATGRIAMMPVGQSIVGNQVGFTAAQWFWTAANVKTTFGGNFDAQILDITAELIIDVNGYYQDTDNLDSLTEMDINYSDTLGDALQVSASAATGSATAIRADSSSATGIAIEANNFAGGTALRLGSGGKLAIGGASGVNSASNTAFVHSTTASTICATNFSIIKHSQLNDNPGAMIILQPRYETTTASATFHTATSLNAMVGYYVGGCNADSATTGHWYIYTPGVTMAANLRYSVLIINP